MILAPTAKFIFIHVPKAAGTSIKAALSPHDAFLPVRHGDAAARRRHAEKLGLPAATAALDIHASARHIIAALGRATYDTYYSFAFVRNPWDTAVSWFHYRFINPQIDGHAEAFAAGTFQAYARTVLTGPGGKARIGLQHPYVVDDTGAVAVKFIGHHETLTDDFARVSAVLGVPLLMLDRFNQSYHPDWPRLYDRETFDIVARLVATDAALFGYSTDPAAYGL